MCAYAKKKKREDRERREKDLLRKESERRQPDREHTDISRVVRKGERAEVIISSG